MQRAIDDMLKKGRPNHSEVSFNVHSVIANKHMRWSKSPLASPPSHVVGEDVRASVLSISNLPKWVPLGSGISISSSSESQHLVVPHPDCHSGNRPGLSKLRC
eukprot:4618533-Amphidinium_carterae.1